MVDKNDKEHFKQIMDRYGIEPMMKCVSCNGLMLETSHGYSCPKCNGHEGKREW